MNRAFRPRQQDILKKVWEDPNSFATTLLVTFIDIYGLDAIHWSPTTIHWEIQEDHGITMPGPNFDRLMAAITIVTTNVFYTMLSDFSELCCVLSGESASPGMLQLPDAADIAWGLTEGIMMWPPEDEEESPFSEEIVGFVSETIRQEGIINPPDILRLGQLGSETQERVRMDFSDDPEMFSAVYKMEGSKTDDINRLVKDRLHMLFDQLVHLPLKNGNVADVANRMKQNLSTFGKSR